MSRRAKTIALLALACVVALPGNGADRPLAPHEVFVARTSTEMLRRDDWIVPYFNGEPRLQKPPLAYWLAMALHRASGADVEAQVTPFEARLPAALAAVALALLTAALARAATGDERAGWLAGALLATSSGFFLFAHAARPEMLYALFCTLFLYGLVLVHEHFEDRTRRRRAGLLAWTGFALAVLAKGPFLPLFLLVGASFAWVRARGVRTLLAFVQPLSGLVLVGGSAALYFLLVARRVPGAVDLWLADMFEDSGKGDSVWLQPLKLYYPLHTPTLLLPWIVFVPGAVTVAFRRASADAATPLRILFFGVAFAMLFLSFSAGPHAYYMLPGLPALCALMAGGAVAWYDRLEEPRRSARATTLGRLHAGLVALGGLALVAFAARPPAFAPAGPVRTAAMVGLATLALAAAARAWRRPGVAGAPAVVAGVALLLCGFGLSGWIWAPSRYTEATFAREVAGLVPPERPIVATIGCEVSVYYGDRTFEVARLADLEEVPGLVLGRASKLAAAGVEGVRLAQEPHSDDPAVLLDSTGRP